MGYRQNNRTEDSAHVLVVDDTPDNAHLLCQILEFNGYRTTVASDGMQALELVGRQPPDIILLDVMMPVMDGYEVTRQLRADPTLPFIPIILVTAKMALPDKLEGLESGADDYLTKPVNRHELLARVRGLLRLKRAQDALRAEQHKTALLHRLGRQLSSSLDLAMVLQLTIEHAMEAFGATHGYLLMLDDQGRPWRTITVPPPLATAASQPVPPATQPVFAGLLAAREPQLIADLADDPRCSGMPEHFPQHGSAISAVLYHQQQLLGLLVLLHEAPGAFRVQQRDLLIGVADQVSLALHNALLYTRLRDAEAAREQMLSLLAHDMRTPLAGVINCLELLNREDNHATDNELIGMALEACRYQDGLIGDLLDLHRAEAGQLQLDIQPLALHAAVAALVEEMTMRAQQKQITLSSRVPADLLVQADGRQLVRVLSNLLRSAIKYTPHGGNIVVGVQREVDAPLVRISVEDTGYTIAPEALQTIFDRFYHPQESQHSGRRGVGVGLAFCAQIVTMHGGRIWADKLAQGTRISFTLPAISSDQEDFHAQVAASYCR